MAYAGGLAAPGHIHMPAGDRCAGGGVSRVRTHLKLVAAALAHRREAVCVLADQPARHHVAVANGLHLVHAVDVQQRVCVTRQVRVHVR